MFCSSIVSNLKNRYNLHFMMKKLMFGEVTYVAQGYTVNSSVRIPTLA